MNLETRNFVISHFIKIFGPEISYSIISPFITFNKEDYCPQCKNYSPICKRTIETSYCIKDILNFDRDLIIYLCSISCRNLFRRNYLREENIFNQEYYILSIRNLWPEDESEINRMKKELCPQCKQYFPIYKRQYFAAYKILDYFMVYGCSLNCAKKMKRTNSRYVNNFNCEYSLLSIRHLWREEGDEILKNQDDDNVNSKQLILIINNKK